MTYLPTVNGQGEDESSVRYRDLFDINNTYSFELIAADPISFEEVTKSDDWITIIHEEMSTIHKNKIWELTNLPKGKHAIGLKWIFKSKFNLDESLLRKKARVVTKRYSYQEGINFKVVFSLVTRIETICLFFTIGTQKMVHLSNRC